MPDQVRNPAAQQDMDDATACLALADGSLFFGQGYGIQGEIAGIATPVTAMAGYQEILSDPAHAGQILVFTFPHVGNVGTTPQDNRASSGGALGMATAQPPTAPSNWRATGNLPDWLAARGMVGIAGIDTRRLALHLRDHGPQGAAIAHDPAGRFDGNALIARAQQAGKSA